MVSTMTKYTFSFKLLWFKRITWSWVVKRDHEELEING